MMFGKKSDDFSPGNPTRLQPACNPLATRLQPTCNSMYQRMQPTCTLRYTLPVAAALSPGMLGYDFLGQDSPGLRKAEITNGRVAMAAAAWPEQNMARTDHGPNRTCMAPPLVGGTAAR